MGEPLRQILLDFIPPDRAAGFDVLAWELSLALALAFVAILVLCAVIRDAVGWGLTAPPEAPTERDG